LNIHDLHLLFGGFRASPAPLDHLPGLGGEKSLFASLTDSVRLEKETTAPQRRQEILSRFKDIIVTFRTQVNDAFGQSPRARFYELLLGQTPDLSRESVLKGLDRAYRIGWFSDSNEAPTIAPLLQAAAETPSRNTRINALERLVDNLTQRAVRDLGPLSVSSVTAELQILQATYDFFSEARLLLLPPDRSYRVFMDGTKVFDFRRFYEFYIAKHENGDLISRDEVREALRSAGVSFIE
jgi:hypothetical protein